MKQIRNRFSARMAFQTVAALALVTGFLGQAAAQQPVLKVDLRKEQTPILNQGPRGNCVDFAVAGAMEAAYKRAGYGELHLSEEFSHDVAKMMYLDPPDAKRASNQAENHTSALGGGNVAILLRMLCHGLALPEARFMPYHLMDYPTGKKADWKNQFVVSSFNLNPLHLPTKALRADRYFSVQSVQFLPHANDPKAIEQTLRDGHEVIWCFRVSGDRKGPIWKYTGPPGPKDGSHATLLVGYDRTDPENPYFIVKNSWGKTQTPGADGFTYISYEYLNYGTDAAYITAVAKPGPRPGYAFLGRWYASFPGHKGILDLYRVPGVMNSLFQQQKYKDAKGQVLLDRRLGTFYEDCNLEQAYRVNGTIQGGKLQLTIDWARPNLPYNELGDFKVALTVAKQNANLLEGSVTSPNLPDGAASAQRLFSMEAFEDQPPSLETLGALPELVLK